MKMKFLFLSALVVLSIYADGAPPPADGAPPPEETKEEEKKEYVRKKWGDAALLEALSARYTALDAAYNGDKWADLGQLFTGNARLISYKTNATEGRDNVVGFFKHVKEFVLETTSDNEDKTEEKKEGEEKKETEKKEEKKEEKPKVTPKVTFKYEILFAAKLGDNMAWAKGEYNIINTASNYHVDAGRFNEWYTVNGGRYQSSELVMHSDYGSLEPPPVPYDESFDENQQDGEHYKEGEHEANEWKEGDDANEANWEEGAEDAKDGEGEHVEGEEGVKEEDLPAELQSDI